MDSDGSFYKSVDGVHGIRTRGSKMVGIDKSTFLLHLVTFELFLFYAQIQKQWKIRNKEQGTKKELKFVNILKTTTSAMSTWVG